jgi:N-acyl homoserine lactone hydrolase
MVTYELHPLIVGVLAAFPFNRFVYGSDDATPLRAPCVAWLARGSDGSVILVDTGPAVQTAVTAEMHMELHILPEHRIDNAVRAAGVDPASVKKVLLTHLHFDHCGGGEYLPNAEFYVQRRELENAVGPVESQRRGYEVGYSGVTPGWLSVVERLRLVDGLVDLAPGVQILPLPGHTPGSAGAVFATSGGRIAVASDLVSLRENWGEAGGEHIPPAAHTDLDDCRKSFELLERSADAVLPSHDFRTAPMECR